jgi:NADH dehydrogenase
MSSQKHNPKLIILGAGWGSVALQKQLDAGENHVIVVSPENHYLFTPTLPLAMVGTLELKSLVEPIRQIVRRVRDHCMKASAEDVDFSEKLVENSSIGATGVKENFYLPYNELIIGVGAISNLYGDNGLEHCHFLKSIGDTH